MARQIKSTSPVWICRKGIKRDNRIKIGVTDLLMGREDGEAGSSWLVLIWSAESPESDWATTELGEPALKLRLGGVVWKTSHVKDLAALRQEGSDIGTGIHWSGEDIWVLVCWLRLGNQAAENPGKSDCLLHGTAWRSWCQSLEVEWQVVLDWGRCGDWLNLEGGADVGEHRWAEWERLWVVLLPSLVLGAEIESTGVLEVWWKDNGLIASLTWKLNTEIPRIERDEREIEVLGGQILVGECIETGNGISESACIADVLPGKGSKAGYILG